MKRNLKPLTTTELAAVTGGAKVRHVRAFETTIAQIERAELEAHMRLVAPLVGNG